MRWRQAVFGRTNFLAATGEPHFKRVGIRFCSCVGRFQVTFWIDVRFTDAIASMKSSQRLCVQSTTRNEPKPNEWKERRRTCTNEFMIWCEVLFILHFTRNKYLWIQNIRIFNKHRTNGYAKPRQADRKEQKYTQRTRIRKKAGNSKWNAIFHISHTHTYTHIYSSIPRMWETICWWVWSMPFKKCFIQFMLWRT